MEIRALLEIAALASQREVISVVAPAVLLRDDVLDVCVNSLLLSGAGNTRHRQVPFDFSCCLALS